MLFGTRYFLSQVKQFWTFHHILEPSFVCLVTGLGGFLYLVFFLLRTYMFTCNLVFFVDLFIGLVVHRLFIVCLRYW